MSAVLRVSGLNVEVCLANTTIQPYRLENGTAHFLVSDCDFGDASGQLRDALAFLSNHAADIRLMMQTPESTATLDFAREAREEGFSTWLFLRCWCSAPGSWG